jgi:hypothetical protein
MNTRKGVKHFPATKPVKQTHQITNRKHMKIQAAVRNFPNTSDAANVDP